MGGLIQVLMLLGRDRLHFSLIANIDLCMSGNDYLYYSSVCLLHVCTFIHLGKIPVEALLRSHVMDEFIELRGDPDLWYGREGNNWFSVANISKIHQEVRKW